MFALFEIVLESLAKRANDRQQRKCRATEGEVPLAKRQQVSGDGSSDEKVMSGSSEVSQLELDTDDERVHSHAIAQDFFRQPVSQESIKLLLKDGAEEVNKRLRSSFTKRSGSAL